MLRTVITGPPDFIMTRSPGLTDSAALIMGAHLNTFLRVCHGFLKLVRTYRAMQTGGMRFCNGLPPACPVPPAAGDERLGPRDHALDQLVLRELLSIVLGIAFLPQFVTDLRRQALNSYRITVKVGKPIILSEEEIRSYSRKGGYEQLTNRIMDAIKAL